MKTKLSILVTTLLLASIPALFSASVGEKPDEFDKKWGLPDSPTGEKCAAFLTVIHKKNIDLARRFLNQHLAPEFLSSVSMEEHLKQFKWMHDTIGELEVLGITKTSPSSAALKIRSKESGKKYKATLEFEPKESYRIANIDVQASGGYGLKSNSDTKMCASPKAGCCAPKN